MRALTGFVMLAAGLLGGLVTGLPPAAAAVTPGIISTVAGGPGRGPARQVFQQPWSVAAGPEGALFVGDQDGAVREFTMTKTYETVTAGVGVPSEFGGRIYGQPAVRAELTGFITGVAIDNSGNEIITEPEANRVLAVAASTGTFYGQAMTAGDIYSVAGNGDPGFAGDGGPAASAELLSPESVAVDAAGNLILADSENYRLRVVAATSGTFYGQAMTAGDIYTIAGSGKQGYSGDGGPATSAELSFLRGVTVDAAGNVVLTDTANDRVRVAAAKTGTFYGKAMTAGDIYTIAGTGTAGYSGDGGPATSAELNSPGGIVADSAGNLVIADTSNDRVRVVAAKTGTFYGKAMTAGDIYTIAGTGTAGYSGDGGPAAAATLQDPEAVTIDSAGNLVIADTSNDRVRVVAAKAGTFYSQAMTTGDIYSVAGNGSAGSSGSGGAALNAEFYAPAKGESVSEVAVDAGNYVLVQGSRAWFICQVSGTYFGQAMTAGDVYAVAGTGFTGYSGDGGPAASAKLWRSAGVAVDAAGNLVIADTYNDRVRVVAAKTGTFYGKAMTAGDIYTIAGTGTAGYSGDGGPAASAELNLPQGVAVDAAGNLVIADTGNSRVRVVAAKTGTFYAKAMTAGDIYTVAGTGTASFSGNGGPAASAELDLPQGLAVDAAGNLIIADTGNSRVRVVAATSGTFYGQAMAAGDIYNVAGDGSCCTFDGPGPANSARLYSPQGVAVDAAGNLIIADTDDYQVLAVAATSGSFYGTAMTAGDIYAVAGSGAIGYSGNNGPAVKAALNYPHGVAVDGAGNIVIADSEYGRVRLVSN